MTDINGKPKCERCWQPKESHDQVLCDKTWEELCETFERRRLDSKLYAIPRTQFNDILAQEKEDPMGEKGKKKLIDIHSPRCTHCGSGMTYGRIKTKDFMCRSCFTPFTRTEKELNAKS